MKGDHKSGSQFEKKGKRMANQGEKGKIKEKNDQQPQKKLAPKGLGFRKTNQQGGGPAFVTKGGRR